MKSSPFFTYPLVLAGTVLASSSTSSDASLYGRGLLVPRRYQYSRRPRTDPTFDLVGEILSMPVYMNNLLRQHQTEMGRMERSSATPNYAVTDDPETGVVELSVELPGVLAKDLSVTLEDNRLLRIRGSRTNRGPGATTYETEFDQSFQLTDDLDPQQLQVTLSAGILRVQAHKKEKLVRQIPILTSSDSSDPEIHLTTTNKNVDESTDEATVIDVKAENVIEEVDGTTIKEDEV